jgi:tetratricopeptide (TPR) repeat protein
MMAPRIARVIGVATMLAMMAVGRAHADPTRADRDQGLRLYEAGRFAEAIPYFDRVLERHHRDIEVRLKRGACYLRTDQPQKALADFDWVNGFSRFGNLVGLPYPAGPTDPYYPDSFGNRGIALLMLGRDQEALESFQQSVALWNRPWNTPQFGLGMISGGWPNRPDEMRRGRAASYQGLGQAYHRLGQAPAAIEAYNQAIAIYASDPNAFVGRGDVLADRKLFDEALADYAEAIRLDPSHSRAFAGRGIVFYLQGRDEAAIADFDRSIALDTDFAKAYSYRGAARSRLGRNDQALADYDAVIRLMPESAGAYKDRGGVLYRLGRYDSAIRDLDEAVRLDPKKASAYQNRGAARNALGQFERAIDDLDEAIRLDPKNAGAHSNRGLAHFAIGEYDRAIADLSEAIRLDPKNAVTHFNRAEVFVRLDMRERALEDYTAAIRLAPRLAPAYAAIGRLEVQLGHPQEAMRDFNMALRLDPKGVGVGVYQDRGNVRREGGDWAGALADYDRAIALQPRRAELYVARGWARLGSGAEWADNDARAYLALKGWHDPLSPYMALLAVLGARGTPRETEARRLLDEAIVNRHRRTWPGAILAYFRGEIDEATLLRSADGTRHQAEAHAFIGLDRLTAGDRAVARPHLEFARDHGSPGSIAADVAHAAIGRIESGG